MKILKTSYTSLPDIGSDFCNGSIDDIRIGPRNQVTLAVTRLIWEGDKARPDSQPTYIRIGGVKNIEAVKDFFEGKPQERSELYRVDYAQGVQSKVGQLFVELSFERVQASMVIECQNISIFVEEIPDL